MHIPDGYLAPAVSVGLGAVVVPAWSVAAEKTRRVLDDRTVPLLALFSALSFTIMLFNIPVPGGTTAHGVGGTLVAIVLGPWAAAIAVSTALILQALFFGDGGILAIFANCLNMAFLLPFSGYAVYRLVAARAPLDSTRRVVAAGIGSYVGLTVAALAVGIELGVQPIFFSQGGRPLYSPYGLDAAVPAMLVSHLFGASIVEGLIGALGVAFLQHRHPEYLVALRVHAAPASQTEDRPDATGDAGTRSWWRLVLGAVAGSAVLLALAGLLTSGGDPSRLFGADWSGIDWPSVGAMLLTVALIGCLAVPLAWILLPARFRRVGATFVALAVISPLGLIAPGFAYGEGGPGDVQAAFGYVPQGLRDLASLFGAPFADYNVPLPFFSEANAPLWHAAVGYEIAALAGVLLVCGAAYGLARAITARSGVFGSDGTGPSTGRDEAASRANAGRERAAERQIARAGASEGRSGWLERTLAGVTESVEQAIFTERLARAPGWLQRRDPRAKAIGFLVLLLAASLTTSLFGLALLYGATLTVAWVSLVPLRFFVRRVWVGVPLFAALVVVPAVFLAPGARIFEMQLGPIPLAPSWNGLSGAVLLVSRVGVSVSLAVLLVLTTPWADILKSLRSLGVPQAFVLVLSMTYRYLFLFLHTVNGMLLARKSRVVGRSSGGEQRRWIAGTMGSLMGRAFKMSNEVYAAMLARGFAGEARVYGGYHMLVVDWLGLGGVFCLAVGSVASGWVLP